MRRLTSSEHRYYYHLRLRGNTYFKKIMKSIEMYHDMIIIKDYNLLYPPTPRVII